MALKIITPPTEEPLSIIEAKKQGVIEHEEDDLLVSEYIKAAREYCQNTHNRAFGLTTYELWLDNWRECIELPMPPLVEVLSVKYYDTDNVEHDIEDTDYLVDDVSEPGRLIISKQPSNMRKYNAIVIRYKAGGDVSELVKQAMRLAIAEWYKNREVGELNSKTMDAIKSLLSLDRVRPV